jgi:hypothetical protein
MRALKKGKGRKGISRVRRRKAKEDSDEYEMDIDFKPVIRNVCQAQQEDTLARLFQYALHVV